MSALLPATRYLVSYGKTGGIGVFLSPSPLVLRRGTAVIVQTGRGVEWGTILSPASEKTLGLDRSGVLIRPASADDHQLHESQATLAQRFFALSREQASEAGLQIEILDVDLLFDQQTAILQYLGTETEFEAFAEDLEATLGLAIRFENLAIPIEPEPPQETGCDNPDCGKEAGGCTTCSTGGGCSSCGTKVDLRDYFGHLRTKMEDRRVPLN